MATVKQKRAQLKRSKFQSDKLAHQLMESLITILREEEKPFKDLLEEDQWDHLWEIQEAVTELVREAVRVISATGHVAWAGNLDSVVMKLGKAEVKVTGTISDSAANLGKSFNGAVMVVLCDPEVYLKNVHDIHRYLVRDQKDLVGADKDAPA